MASPSPLSLQLLPGESDRTPLPYCRPRNSCAALTSTIAGKAFNRKEEVMTVPAQLVPGIHWWTTPHPEYRTAAEEVASYALVIDDAVALVDPLVPGEEDPEHEAVLAGLDRLVLEASRLEICITIPYHTRSTERLFERYWGQLATRVWGHAAVRKRFQWDTPLNEMPKAKAGQSAEIGDCIASAWAIGNPRRYETPLFFPGLKALAFGDAVVALDSGELRVWDQSGGSPDWYERRLLPTLQPLAVLEADRVLVTHGSAVLQDGRKALESALAAPPVPIYW
jgi:glyoxylase-like metal-dependent hydrolase (beta-lactamase superfamily II)